MSLCKAYYNFSFLPFQNNKLPSQIIALSDRIHQCMFVLFDCECIWQFQPGYAGCRPVKGVTWCWWEGCPERSAVAGTVWTQRGPTPAYPWMRSACWDSWELCRANHVKVNKLFFLIIKKKKRKFLLKCITSEYNHFSSHLKMKLDSWTPMIHVAPVKKHCCF